MNQTPNELSGYLAFSQSKIDFFNESNHELTQDEIQEAIRLSGYTKRDKTKLSNICSYTGNNTGSSTNLTNTGRMWAMALSGIWKTMMDKDGWKLPATFDSYNICGKGFFKACFGDNYAKRFVYHCGRIGCEICAKRAGSRIAKKIERRITLYSLRIQKLSKGRKTPLASHVIESIEPNSEFWNYTKEKQNRILKKMRIITGIRGGCVINHLWRFDKSDLTPMYSPHKHLIAFGWIKENASQLIKEQLGIDVVYHKVRNGTLRNRVDVFAVAFYQLSHCAVKQNKQSVQWFGELANNKLSNKILEQYKDEEYILQDEEIERSKCCPVCSEKLEPCKINKYSDNWRRHIPPIDQQEKGFEFDFGLFLSLDFNGGEKIPYYDKNFDVIYKETLREQKEKREGLRPDLYDKKTINQKVIIFL